MTTPHVTGVVVYLTVQDASLTLRGGWLVGRVRRGAEGSMYTQKGCLGTLTEFESETMLHHHNTLLLLFPFFTAFLVS